ncbi:MAG TPA: hypothetical protein VMX13_02235 [Sedimentisphaerales bacterium]|nr:hypothetical protein [Sedimentisphaerales bacterium]
MKTKKVLFYVLAGILAGCVPVMSLHPLYTEQDTVFEEKLLGVWVDDPNGPEAIWEFKRPDESKKEYELIFSDKEGQKGIFTTYLVKLKERLFLDAYPKEFPCEADDPNKMAWHYNSVFLVPVHTFMKIDCIEPLQTAGKCLSEAEQTDADALKKLSADYDSVLKLRLTDDEEFKKLLEQDPNAIKHEKVKDDGIVLTASPGELQAFVLKYADDERLFSKPQVLIRRKASVHQGTTAEGSSKAEEKEKPAPPEKK